MELENRNGNPVAIDILKGGNFVGSGSGLSVARKLMACNFQPQLLRTNDLLHKEEWLQLDQVVEGEVLRRLRGIQDLMQMGLEYNMRSVGLGKTVIQWETSSDMGPADVSMDGVARATQDKVLLSPTNLLPLYITHKDVTFSAREIAAGRMAGGTPIDTMNVQMAARKVAEALETMLFTGASEAISLPTKWGSAVSYSYTTAPNRVTTTLTYDWNNGSATPATILADVLSMKQAAIGNRFYGPYVLYVPVTYESVLDKDYSIVSNVVTDTIRSRILKIGNIVDVRVADFLPDKNVLLIQMTPDVVDLVVTQDPIIVPWEEQGGMLLHFKVMACMVPRMKSTFALRSGLIHYYHS